MWTLVKLILRRDRIKLPVWILASSLTLLSIIPVLRSTYGEQQAIDALYQTFSANASGLFITGPMNAPTFGGLMTTETVLWWGMVVAFMSTLLIVRHTRLNEDMGAQELLLSGQIKRSDGLVAALIVAAGANIINGIIVAVGLWLLGGDSIGGAESAWLYGSSMALSGLVWAVIAAVVVQLVGSSRSSNGMLAMLIGIAFVLRGIGDFMGTNGTDGLLHPMWPSSLSPLGWLEAARALTYPDWSSLTTPAIFVVVATIVALALLSIRDEGAGILPSRRGRARSTRFGRTNLGLTWRMQRNICFGWLAGIVSMAGIVGMLAPEMTRVYNSSDSMKMLIESLGGTGALVPTFLAAMISVIILMAAAYVVQAMVRIQGEELSGHLENILVTKISRIRWLYTHLSVVLASAMFMLLATGLMLPILVNLLSDVRVEVIDYVVAALAYTPAALIFIGIYVLFFGLIPRWAGLITWLYLGIVVFLSWLAPVFNLSEGWYKISILHYLPPAPAEPIDVWVIVWMTTLSLALIIIGGIGWLRRDSKIH